MLIGGMSYNIPEFNDSFDDLFSEFCDSNKIKSNKNKVAETQDEISKRVTRSGSKQISNLITSLDTIKSPLIPQYRRKRKSNVTSSDQNINFSEYLHLEKSSRKNISSSLNRKDKLKNGAYLNSSIHKSCTESNTLTQLISNKSDEKNNLNHNSDIKENFIYRENLFLNKGLDLVEILNNTDETKNVIEYKESLKGSNNISLNNTDYVSKSLLLDSFFDEVFVNKKNINNGNLNLHMTDIDSVNNTNIVDICDKSDKILENSIINKSVLISNNILEKEIYKTPTSSCLSELITSDSNLVINKIHNLQDNESKNNVNNSNKYFTSISARIKNVLKTNCRNLVAVKSNLISNFEDVKNYEINCDNSFYGLPIRVKKLFHKYRKIDKLYEWQEECLKLDMDMNGKNLIYSLPTSGGKTLVAEILILRQLLLKQKDVLFIMPFVAIVQEKIRNMSFFASELGFSVEEFAGGKGSLPPRIRRLKNTLYIATIEKAAGLINSLIGCQRINELGLVVVDELHMIGEKGGRGAILETLLALLMYCAEMCQVVGMSATLNNIDDLCQFLNAKLYTNDFRPVQLCEQIKLGCDIFVIDKRHNIEIDEKIKYSRSVNFNYSKEMNQLDRDCIAGLVLEVIPQNSCLVFCATKKNCENVAQLICQFMSSSMKEIKLNERLQILNLLRETTELGEICPILKMTIPWGVAFHHGGLTNDERKIIEEAYSQGVINCLTCTSTLAAGVNLPAKRVILRSPYVGASFISCTQYKQMVGRAGRAGIDTSGESITIVENKDKTKFIALLESSFEKCLSCLLDDNGKSIKSFILSTVGLKIVKTKNELLEVLKCSLCWKQHSNLHIHFESIVEKYIYELIKDNLIVQKIIDSDSLECVNSILETSDIGRAIYKGSICISIHHRLYKDLKEGLNSLVVSSPLHLLYLITPYEAVQQININWNIFLNEVTSLTFEEQLVANIIKIPESYIHRKVAGQALRNQIDELSAKRFYVSLMLLHIWKQDNVWHVASKFQMNRGSLQQIISSASSFASCVHHYTQELEEFWAYRDLFASFVKRLSFCSCAELIPLLEIPGIKSGRALQLYKAGFRDISSLAHSNPKNLISKIEHMTKKMAKEIITFAKLLLSERAEALIEEADMLVNN